MGGEGEGCTVAVSRGAAGGARGKGGEGASGGRGPSAEGVGGRLVCWDWQLGFGATLLYDCGITRSLLGWLKGQRSPGPSCAFRVKMIFSVGIS